MAKPSKPACLHHTGVLITLASLSIGAGAALASNGMQPPERRQSDTVGTIVQPPASSDDQSYALTDCEPEDVADATAPR